MSYDIKVWCVIKKGNIPIPSKKDKDGEIIVSPDPLDLDDYTEEQANVIQVNARATNILYNAISGEEYEKISRRETAKEMWDKLEVTYEGTNKVKETRINLLDLDKMSYEELRDDLIAFEKTHLDRQIHQEKRKIIAFKAIVAESEIEEEQ
ncbi:uncharacterized protein [Nicotiana tomentosiformis]|uniref:uncharacterized protein n=1 Tax=Nicotiana tomentosiformis TaxID=4098 RepID=UPI00388C8351